MQAGGADTVLLGEGDDDLRVFVFLFQRTPEPGGLYDGGNGRDSLVIDIPSYYEGSGSFIKGVLTVNSTIVAEAANFESYDYEGKFKFVGGSGDDKAEGRFLVGGSGDDELYGKGAAKLYGGVGDDALVSYLDPEADRLDGGEGTDTLWLRADYSYFAADLSLTGDAATLATLTADGKVIADISGIERIAISLYEGNDSISTGAGDDIVYGGGGSDVISLGEGDDECGTRLDGGFDLIDMGDGRDLSSVDVTGYNSLVMIGDSDAMRCTVDGVDASLILNSERFRIAGGGGGDILRGAGGADTISAGGGADVIYGRAGRDVINLGDLDAGHDLVSGGGGADVIKYSARYGSAISATASSGSSFVVTQDGAEILKVTGGESVQAIGSQGDDTLVGLSGDDTLAGLGGSDLLIGGDGRDLADFSDSRAGVYVQLIAGEEVQASIGGIPSDRLVEIEDLKGTDYADTLIGDSGDNDLYSRGWDVLDGGAGSDTYVVYGDNFRGLVDLTSSSVQNIENARGSSGVEVFIGNADNNHFESGGALDTMVGGEGADVFGFTLEYLFQEGLSTSFAEITDLSQNEHDKIDFGQMLPHGERWHYLGTNVFSGAENELRYFEDDGLTWVLADFDGDKATDFRLRLDESVTLEKGDFIL